jgi:hypothetical protein
MHACPVGQPDPQLADVAGAHVPEAQVSPGAQSVAAEQVQVKLVCVAVHFAVGPH